MCQNIFTVKCYLYLHQILRPIEICLFFQHGDRLYTSESDVYRPQILTYKDGPRAERLYKNTQVK